MNAWSQHFRKQNPTSYVHEIGFFMSYFASGGAGSNQYRQKPEANLFMAWIESHQRLEKSGKLIRLCEILKINKAQAIGHLHCLWWWALDNAKDGDLSRYDDNVICLVSGWREYMNECVLANKSADFKVPECNAFCNACVTVGFIDKELKIHDWEEYTGRYFSFVERRKKSRDLSRDRVRRFRLRNANVTHDVTLRNVTTGMVRYGSSKEVKATATPVILHQFNELWNSYPKRIGKKMAFRHYNHSVKTEEDFRNIKIALGKYKSHIAGKEIQYIQNASTWFNNWQDWIDFKEEKDASHGGTSIFEQVAKRERERESEALRASGFTRKPISTGL